MALADCAEREAVDGIWIGSLGGAGIDPGDSYRTMVSAAVAARTRFVRIGCVLNLTASDQVLRLAEDVAMIDEASGGRLELAFELEDAEREASAVRLLSAWRGWATADGRRFPVTPRPAQPSLPRLVTAQSFDSPAAARLAAGVLVRAEALHANPPARLRFERRVIALEVRSVRDLLSHGPVSSVAPWRHIADRHEADEVAIWLGAEEPAAIADEVRLLAKVVAPAIAGGATQWEMLAELGARAAGLGGHIS